MNRDLKTIKEQIEKSIIILKNNNDVMNILIEKLDFLETDFSNGKGYYQHDPKNVRKLKKLLIEYGKIFINHEIFSTDIDKINTRGIISKIIEDSGDYYLNSMWYNLMNIDDDGRQWGQLYYALNPNKGTDLKLNKYIDPIFRKEKIKNILND